MLEGRIGTGFLLRRGLEGAGCVDAGAPAPIYLCELLFPCFLTGQVRVCRKRSRQRGSLLEWCFPGVVPRFFEVDRLNSGELVRIHLMQLYTCSVSLQGCVLPAAKLHVQQFKCMAPDVAIVMVLING